MAMQPSGTVTFLFTDIEGSTALIHALGSSGYASALDDHRRLLRDAFARNDGYEVDTQGDAFFVAFNRVQDAISAAAEAQHELAGHAWPNGHVLRVRMGIHTTQAMLTAGSYVGVGVHRAARICAAPAATLDLGEHRLKDLTEAQHLFLADCALLDGDCSTAQERYARSLDAAWRMGDEAETCYELQGMAMSAAGLGQTERGLTRSGLRCPDLTASSVGPRSEEAATPMTLCSERESSRVNGRIPCCIGPQANSTIIANSTCFDEGRRRRMDRASQASLRSCGWCGYG